MTHSGIMYIKKKRTSEQERLPNIRRHMYNYGNTPKSPSRTRHKYPRKSTQGHLKINSIPSKFEGMTNLVEGIGVWC